MLRFAEAVRPTVRRPFFRRSFLIIRSGAGRLGAASEDELEPVTSEDRFQCPAALRRSITSGFSIVSPVMCTARDVIRVSTSTPILNDFAVRKGDLLKAGSSAIDRSSAEREPETSEKS